MLSTTGAAAPEAPRPSLSSSAPTEALSLPARENLASSRIPATPLRLYNAVIDGEYAGQVVRGAVFTGQTTVLGSARGVVFEDCTFDAEWNALYAIRVPAGERPRARFLRCEIRNAIAKGVVAQWCFFLDCIIEDCGSDGIFAEGDGWLHIEGCTIQNLGRRLDGTCDGLHADGIQLAIGSHYTIRDNTIVVPNGCDDPAIGRQGNSCIFVETDWSPIDSIRISGNTLIGGIYTIWIRDDTHGPPTSVRIYDNYIGGFTNGSLFASASVGSLSGFLFTGNEIGDELSFLSR